MVDFIKRDRNDMFNNPILGFLFKNSKFLLTIRIAVAGLFFYAIYYGFVNPTKDNIFTGAVFWGVFWSLFMVVTLSTFGRIFCGICPHGFLGKYITKMGLKKSMPQWMQNRYIGLSILVIGWWAVFYTFDGFWKSPYNTALMFAIMTLVSFVIYFIYKDMSYCKYICPIGTLTRAYDKLSFTKLETYTDSCKDCRTFECASACSYNLKPFTFAKKNQTDDCTLCMDCANSCEAVKFKFTKPAEQLSSKLNILTAEVWAYILILACIPVSMGFAHGLNRSKIADEFIWNKTAAFFGLSEYAGGFAFIYALLFTVLFSVVGLFLASKVLKKDFGSTFTNLGVALIPLFIFSSLGHTLETFFTREYQEIVHGFAQGFGFVTDVEPLAKRGDGWLHYFGLFKWIGIVWAFVILYKRMKLIDSTKIRKLFGYIFASMAILFFLGLNIYTGYVFSKYGAKAMGGHSHGGMNKEMFQSVSFKEATLLQHGKDKTSGVVCGMNLPMFYKTNHSAVLDGKVRQYCSLHCLTEDLKIKHLPLTNIQVVDVTSLKFIDVASATYVVGSTKKGTMSKVSKYAFANKRDAYKFAKRYGGEVVDFNGAVNIALKDFSSSRGNGHKKDMGLKDDEPIHFSLTNPNSKKRSGMMSGMMMGMGSKKDKNQIPTKQVWLVDSHNRLVKNIDAQFFYFDTKFAEHNLSVQSKMGTTVYSFDIPNNGYYNLFAQNYTIKDGTLFYKVAKLEYLNGRHGGEDIYTDDIKKELSSNGLKIDLIRIKDKDENSFFYKHSMGDTLVFKALLNGKPLSNAKLNIKLSSGWSKRIVTDENAIAKFTIIRDYFPKWNEFEKRYKEDFVITLKYDEDQAGSIDNKPYNKATYMITYPASYYPNDSDYRSYGFALVLITITLLASGIIIYRFRKNRTKPFSEVRLDG